MELYKWSTTAANNDSAVPDGAPNGWLGANVNEWARETMAQARAHASDAAYVDETYQLAAVGTKTLVRNSATQFTVQSCDATAHFIADRRIRIVGATTGYGYVTSSVFSTPHTIVDVVMESGDVPTSPTRAYVHVDTKLRSGAYAKTGAGLGLDADKVDGYHAADLYGPALYAEALVNGSMLVWQRGTSGSCPAATRTYHADRWWTNPSGAAVTCARGTNGITGAVSPYLKVITGATSVTTCELAGQRIESYLSNYLRTTVTISALVSNLTGADLTLSLLLGTPGAADDFTTVTNRLTQALTTIASGGSARLSHTVDISGYTNLANGLEIKFRSPSGALDSGSKIIGISEIQIDRASTFSFFRFNPFPDELVRCERYFRKTFPYATAPAQASGTFSGALHCQMNAQGGGDNPRGAAHWIFGSRMRATPTVTTFNPTQSLTGWRSQGDSANRSATVLNEGETGVFIHTDTNAADNARYAIHATAEAEL